MFLRRDVWKFQLVPEGAQIEDAEDEEGSKRRQLAEEMMREAGGPVKTTAIADRVIELGWPTPSRRKLLINSLSVALDRSPRFVKVKPGLWSLVELEEARQR